MQRKLDKARAEFEREASKEQKREKISEKRRKLRGKVDRAFAKFEDKIAEANETYDEKREKIMSKERGG